MVQILQAVSYKIYSVHRNFEGFEFLQRSQMIKYFVGAPFSFNCPCLIIQYVCFGNTSRLLSLHSCT